MRLKLASMAVAVMAALHPSDSKATIIGVTTNFSKLSVALTVYTNAPTITNSSSEHNAIGTAKIGNVQLLRAFANWTGVTYTNGIPSDPTWAGAILIFDWTGYQVCVADRTGTNILFRAGDGVNTNGVLAFFTLQWIDKTLVSSDGEGPFARMRSTVNPGSDKFTELNRGYFKYHYSNGGDTTDLWAVGAEIDHFAQFWDSLGHLTYWTDSETFKPASADKDNVLHNQQFCAVDGLITATGKGKGSNPALTP